MIAPSFMRFITAGLCFVFWVPHLAGVTGSTPLEAESKIPLGSVRGRIDHLTMDVNRQRLYVAELGNDSGV